MSAFVLAYSRRIMLYYMKAIDPTLQSLIFTYSDTDSLHITGDKYYKLLELGYGKEKKKAKLGYLCSDIKNEGLIFYEKNIAPKCYTYSYIDNTGMIKENDNAVMKSKGIPKKCLKNEYYMEEYGEVEFSSLQKKHKNLTQADKEAGVKNFSVINKTQTRTFNKNNWQGMQFDKQTGEWLPYGYEKSQVIV